MREAEEVCVCTTVLGELYFGALKSKRVDENVARVERLSENVIVLQPDAATARFYGSLKNQLRSLGRPIPDNDLWIAALSEQYDLTLISRDQHFSGIPQLKTEAW